MRKASLYLVAIIFIFSLNSCGYNTMVDMEEQVSGAWSQVENQYQRRADLIPNLVKTVKGYADFEQETLTSVIEARAKASSIQVDANNLDPAQVQQFQQAQEQLSGALSRMLLTVERYPELKANQNFLELQAQLEGTENRISVERKRFNESVQAYNAYIRRFPQNMMAGSFGFERKGYFEAQQGAEQAPSVNF